MLKNALQGEKKKPTQCYIYEAIAELSAFGDDEHSEMQRRARHLGEEIADRAIALFKAGGGERTFFQLFMDWHEAFSQESDVDKFPPHEWEGKSLGGEAVRLALFEMRQELEWPWPHDAATFEKALWQFQFQVMLRIIMRTKVRERLAESDEEKSPEFTSSFSFEGKSALLVSKRTIVTNENFESTFDNLKYAPFPIRQGQSTVSEFRYDLLSAGRGDIRETYQSEMMTRIQMEHYPELEFTDSGECRRTKSEPSMFDWCDLVEALTDPERLTNVTESASRRYWNSRFKLLAGQSWLCHFGCASVFQSVFNPHCCIEGKFANFRCSISNVFQGCSGH